MTNAQLANANLALGDFDTDCTHIVAVPDLNADGMGTSRLLG
jgi:hypothetical protein